MDSHSLDDVCSLDNVLQFYSSIKLNEYESEQLKFTLKNSSPVVIEKKYLGGC